MLPRNKPFPAVGAFASCALICIALVACTQPLLPGSATVPAPVALRKRALDYAQRYIEEKAAYAWGAQDPLPRTIYVDCSGLVVRCYAYAASDFGYRLPFDDMNTAGMQAYCDQVEVPEEGDLCFMGDKMVEHVALFVRVEVAEIGNTYHFIDATTITGCVSERSYPADSPKFIHFGRLRLIPP